MATHAFKGRGSLTIGSVTIEVSTDIALAVTVESVPVAYWADPASDVPGGAESIAQRVTSVEVQMQLHDYAPEALAIAMRGGSVGRVVSLLTAEQAIATSLSFTGKNKLDPGGDDWGFSFGSVVLTPTDSLPLLTGSYGGYGLRGQVLRDTSSASPFGMITTSVAAA